MGYVTLYSIAVPQVLLVILCRAKLDFLQSFDFYLQFGLTSPSYSHSSSPHPGQILLQLILIVVKEVTVFL